VVQQYVLQGGMWHDKLETVRQWTMATAIGPGQRHRNENVGATPSSAEGTKLALYLSNIPAIPFADPTLIIGGHGTRRENRRRKLEKALPLGARAHGSAAPPIVFCGRSRACNQSRVNDHRGGHEVIFKAVLARGLEHEFRWYFLP